MGGADRKTGASPIYGGLARVHAPPGITLRPGRAELRQDGERRGGRQRHQARRGQAQGVGALVGEGARAPRCAERQDEAPRARQRVREYRRRLLPVVRAAAVRAPSRFSRTVGGAGREEAESVAEDAKKKKKKKK